MIRKHLHRLGRLIEQAGGGEVIWEQIAAGCLMREIMEPFVNPDTGKPYDKSLLYQWIHRDPEREKAWKDARRRSAYAKADQAGELLEEMSDDARRARSVGGIPASEVTLVNQRVKYLQWLAGVSNDEFKDTKAGDININLGQLHLEALQAGNRPRELEAVDLTATPALPAPEPDSTVEAEFEFITEDDREP